MAAAATEAGYVVVIFAGRTTLFAIRRATRAGADGHAGTTGDHRAGTTFQCPGLALISAHGARHALLRLRVIVSAHCTWYCENNNSGLDFAITKTDLNLFSKSNVSRARKSREAFKIFLSARLIN